MNRSTFLHLSLKIKKMLYKNDDENDDFKNLWELKNYYFLQQY